MIAVIQALSIAQAYALREIRIAEAREMYAHVYRIAKEEMHAEFRGLLGKPYEWGGSS